MNISPFTIYLWQLADRITPPFVMLTITLAGISIALMITYLAAYSAAEKYAAKNKKSLSNSWLEETKEAEATRDSTLRFLKKTVPGFVFTLVVAVAVPSSNTIAMMVIIPEIAKSKEVQQDIPEIYNAAVEALKRQLVAGEK